MKYYLLAITLLLTNCAVAALIPMPINCETLECSESEYCVEYSDTAVCAPLRRPLGYCDLPCLENQECRFNECLTTNTEGSVCEFDPECTKLEFCILGRCTQAECIPGETRECYSGPDETIGVGECVSGFHLCTEQFTFTEECIGEVVPVPDEGYLACNGEDNDCDGVSDPAELESVDIVFALDLSGSMREENLACALAIQETASLYNHPAVRMALMVFPDPASDSNEDPGMKVITPLVSYDEFVRRMSFMVFSINSSIGTEMSYDLVYGLANNLFPEIVRTPNAELEIILFTDEAGQSYGTPTVGEEEVCEAVNDSNINLYVVTNPNETYKVHGEDYTEDSNDWRYVFFYEGWDDCATLLELNVDEGRIAEHLGEIAEASCN